MRVLPGYFWRVEEMRRYPTRYEREEARRKRARRTGIIALAIIIPLVVLGTLIVLRAFG
jgi:hypothetical protein